jgi:4-hydroxy-2-oxoheptanedioate aldolase
MSSGKGGQASGLSASFAIASGDYNTPMLPQPLLSRFLPFAAAWIIMPMPIALAQTAPKHLNPVIEKLAAGKPFFGVQTGDLSLENARSLARADIDYVYLEMEHGPMDFEGLHRFTVGMIDKTTILKKGNPQPNVAIFARFAPYGREQAQWFVKQALDIGLMGVIFNGIDNREQALLAVRNMRYPQKRNSKYPEPAGLRGYAPANAVWWWGIPEAEYERRADLWPLNPDGDLLAIMMIETAEGLKNADAIAAVPGVGAIFVGAGADLSQYLGVERNSPELEQGFQTILKACLAHSVPCGITATNPRDIAKRLEDGWKMIRTTEAALTQWRASSVRR